MDYLFEWTVPTFFFMSVGMGVRHRSNYTLFLEQGGTLLPDLTYYDLNTTDEEDRNSTISNAGDRRLLFDYYKTLMILTGLDEAEAAHMANQTMIVETMIAQVIKSATFLFFLEFSPGLC
jgi:predicted metalloendopeptidase